MGHLSPCCGSCACLTVLCCVRVAVCGWSLVLVPTWPHAVCLCCEGSVPVLPLIAFPRPPDPSRCPSAQSNLVSMDVRMVDSRGGGNRMRGRCSLVLGGCGRPVYCAGLARVRGIPAPSVLPHERVS